MKTMQQQKLGLHPEPAALTPAMARIERYAAANRECAQIILAEADRYGGPESLMVQWAHMILNGYQATPADWRLVA